MRKFVLAVAAIALVSTPCIAQRPRRGQQPKHQRPAINMVHIKGTINQVVTTPAQGKRGPGIHLIVDTANGSKNVVMGPQNWMEQQDIVLTEGSKIEVTGNQIPGGIIAHDINLEGNTITLRDAQGRPQW